MVVPNGQRSPQTSSLEAAHVCARDCLMRSFIWGRHAPIDTKHPQHPAHYARPLRCSTAGSDGTHTTCMDTSLMLSLTGGKKTSDGSGSTTSMPEPWAKRSATHRHMCSSVSCHIALMASSEVRKRATCASEVLRVWRVAQLSRGVRHLQSRILGFAGGSVAGTIERVLVGSSRVIPQLVEGGIEMARSRGLLSVLPAASTSTTGERAGASASSQASTVTAASVAASHSSTMRSNKVQYGK